LKNIDKSGLLDISDRCPSRDQANHRDRSR
jgi:hypothetical protein